jgi:hypothetical protein
MGTASSAVSNEDGSSLFEMGVCVPSRKDQSKTLLFQVHKLQVSSSNEGGWEDIRSIYCGQVKTPLGQIKLLHLLVGFHAPFSLSRGRDVAIRGILELEGPFQQNP